MSREELNAAIAAMLGWTAWRDLQAGQWLQEKSGSSELREYISVIERETSNAR